MGYERGDSFPFDFLNQVEFYLVQNQKENCRHNHIPFNVEGNGNVSQCALTEMFSESGKF